MIPRILLLCSLLLPGLLWGRPSVPGSLDNTGGPDAGGYTYVDNVAPDTATYAWIELRGDTGATWVAPWINYDDGESAPLPIGFRFPFYGLLRDSFRVNTNGWLRIVAESPNPTALFIFWDDLTLLACGSNGNDRLGYKCFRDYTVIEYDSVRKRSETDANPLKFEAILFRDGRIKFQYQMVSANLTTTSIGIESELNSPGFWWSDPARLPFAGLAVWFVPPPLPGDRCTSPIDLPLPHPGTPTVVTAALGGLRDDCVVNCYGDTVRDVDHFYRMTLPPPSPHTSDPRRLALALRGRGDAHLSIYYGAGNCCSQPLYCNDDDAQFAPLPAWDSTAQHPRGANSYIATYFEPGEYLLRLSSSIPTDSLTLTIYDNTLCDLPCWEPPHLVVTCHPTPDDNAQMELRFKPTWPGTISIYSTTVKNNDGDPDHGADPQWTLDTTMAAPSTNWMTWTDNRQWGGTNNRHYVVYNRDIVVGRCCYTDARTDRCTNSTEAECTALQGEWDGTAFCGADPCPRTSAQP